MSDNPPVLAFFSNKAGVGKTSLVYHLAWMYAALHKRVLAVDLDPQSNLTAMFIEEEAIEALWEEQQTGSTLFRCVEPLVRSADIVPPVLQKIANDLFFLPSDIALSGFEQVLSAEWANHTGEHNHLPSFPLLSAFWQAIHMGAQQIQADIVLVDLAPNLGAINRCALIASDFVLLPLGSDLFSLRALKILGPTLRLWRTSWARCLHDGFSRPKTEQHADAMLPQGQMRVIGYLCQQYRVRLERPITAIDKWANGIPGAYREAVLGHEPIQGLQPPDDPECLAIVRHYRSLVPMAQEHRKPIFSLTPADGAVGSHANAVQGAKSDFKDLAIRIAKKISPSLF